MDFQFLSKNAENVLLELKSLNDQGENAGKYWLNKFAELEMTENDYYCSIFKELSDREMIEVLWADQGPYYISVLNNGKLYFENKRAFENEQKRLSRREWKIAIISGLIGAVVGIVPDIIEWIR